MFYVTFSALNGYGYKIGSSIEEENADFFDKQEALNYAIELKDYLEIPLPETIHEIYGREVFAIIIDVRNEDDTYIEQFRVDVL